MKIYPIVLAGGSGTRLWPLSRELNPKQFLSLDKTGFSLLQNTVRRLDSDKFHTPLIVCNEKYRFLVAEQLRSLGQLDANILLESESKNTAPGVALASHFIHSIDPDGVLLILPADHLICDNEAFVRAIDKIFTFAQKGKLGTFGIIPDSPETGYGYIKSGIPITESVFSVDAFVEKPSLDIAKKYIESKNYFWNSGMFIFSAAKFLSELKFHCPEIYTYTKLAVDNSSRDLDFIRVDSDAFNKCQSISIDYAIMEKTKDAILIPVDIGWSDIGSWSSLWNVMEKSSDGNVIVGESITIDSKNNYIYSDSSLVTTIGIEDVVIVNTDDALLVAKKDMVQDVKKVVDELKSKKHSTSIFPSELYRPWGKISNIDSGPHYQVKKIVVHPKHGLSLQQHFHRSEHWVVLMGIAKVTVNNQEFYLSENESTVIPPGSVHSLENPGIIDLIIIEVRSGTYLADDDIVRLKDRYGRV